MASETEAGAGAGGDAEPSDEALVRAVRAGETDRFEPLVARYQARVFAMARRHARRESDVEDIAQEVFLKAFERLPGYRFEAPFEHWLMRVAVRTCYDHLRTRQRRRETIASDLSDAEEDWLERHAAAPSSGAGDPGVDADAARALVGRLLDSLPPPFRLVITLLELEGRSVQEIARLTGWSVPLVKVRAFRARAAMRKALGRLPRDKYL